jgi:hypothetical protein
MDGNTRWLGTLSNEIELIGFCETSEKAYIQYIQDQSHQMVIMLLDCCLLRQKLDPIKPTLSRLELCGTHLLVKLMDRIMMTMQSVISKTYFTDSMIVLGWIAGDPAKWKTFVNNRVKEIQRLSSREE